MTVAEACFLVELDQLLKDWKIESITSESIKGEYIDIPIDDIEMLIMKAKLKVL